MSNQLATKNDMKSLLLGDQFKEQIKLSLPKHLTPDRFCRIAITALTRTPKLQECTQESFFKCLLDLSSMGLEPDGRRAHLIPHNNRKLNIVECTLIVDYKGLVEMVLNSGDVSNIHADVVCEKDEFIYDLGEVKRHLIDFKGDRGPVYAAYAICTFKDGSKRAEVMGRHEIESIRKRSRSGDNGPWVTDWSEMSKKTVFRRLSKWLPLSPEIREKIEKDDDLAEHERFASAKSVQGFSDALKTTEETVPTVAATVDAEPASATDKEW